MSTNQDSQGSPRSLTRRRQLLRGCLIALAVVLVLMAIAWWFVSRHLGDMLSGVVREQADKALNGRLEFAKLEVDLAGRAVLTDAAVYPQDGQSPWITCPRTVVGFDLFNLFGPNRGKQAVTVSLQKPAITLVREPDGRLNLTRLAKERKPERNPLGLALSVHDAKVDFSDWCLLDEAYPQLEAGKGLEARILEELGYDRHSRAETAVFHELLDVTGTAAVNQQRKELSFNARVVRQAPGGSVSAAGRADLDGATYDIRLSVTGSSLMSAANYIQALFPNLALTASDAAQTTESQSPQLAGLISKAQLRLRKKAAADLEVNGNVDCSDILFLSSALPRLEFPRLRLDLDSGRGSYGSELELHALGSIAQGSVDFDAPGNVLSGRLAVSCKEPAALAAQFAAGELPLQGAVSAQVSLAGSPAEPRLAAQLSSDVLSYEKFKLGKLSGSAQLSGSELQLDGVKLSGGEAQLTAEGNYDLQAGSGRIEVRAGPLPAAQVLDLAARIRPEASLPEVELAGSLSAAVDLAIKSGQVQVALRTWSERLTIAGQRFENLDVKCQVAPPNLKIEEAVARYVGAEPFQLATFHSSGPLSIDLKAGGSVSTGPGQQQAALAIVGVGDTTNLSPSQAHFSFKALGPADDPELRLQIKTTHALEPLVLNAQGHYRRGYAPATATLSWHETKAAFDGRVDLSKQLIDGQVQADNVDLARFSGNPRLSGSLSLAATVGGSFTEPSLSGSLTMPHLSVQTDWRQYSALDATADFELVQGNAISVSQGAFNFEGNAFAVAGRLGQAGSRLSVNCPDFNLLSALAMARPPAGPAGSKSAPTRPPLDVASSGPLAINLTGRLGEPHAQVEYTSGPGQVEGHAFKSAVLSATVTRTQATVTKFSIASEEGNLSLTGDLDYQPLSYTADATVSGFDLGILTPLIDSPYVTGLAGTVDGAIKLGGGTDAYSADGKLTMHDGKFNGLAISEARATFAGSRGTTRITDGLIVADGRVSLSAELHHQPTSYAIAAQFQRFNINAFLPLVDSDLLKGAGGRLDGTLELAGSNGEYNIDGDLLLKDGQFQGVAVSEAQAKVLARGGRIDITDAKIIAEGTQLTGEAHFGPKPADARLTAHASSLDLALLSPFVPEDVSPLAGKLAVDLDLKPGRGKYPDLDLTARSISEHVGARGVSFDSLDANASLKSDNLRLQRCELAAGRSSLYVTAQLDLGLFERQRTGRALPLDITVASSDFDLDDVTALLPEDQRNLMPGGVFTCENVRLGGTSKDPQLSGTVTFDITRMPAYSPYLAMVSRATGSVVFTPGEFDIKRLALIPAGGGEGGSGVVKGSGQIRLNPFELKSGTVDLVLGEQQYMFVNTNEIDPAVLMAAGGSAAQLPLNFSGWVGGTIHIKAPTADDSHSRPVIGGQLTINSEGKTSEIEMLKPGKEEAERAPAAYQFDTRGGLRIDVIPGTSFLYDRGGAPGNLDLRAELVGTVILRGVPGLLNPADPDAFRIDGSLEMPEGSMKVYRHVVRLDSGASRLTFTNSPGDMYPYFTARATLVLPRVLPGGEVYTSTGGTFGGAPSGNERGDLMVIFTISNHKLDPESEPVEALQLDSEPTLPKDQIVAYLLGNAGSVLTGTGSLAQFAQGELQAFGTSFISRYIEDQLNLAAFQVGGTGKEENPYYMDVEKELTPGFSVTYYRDFFSQSYQSEEYGVKYRILDSGNQYSNVDLELNFTKGGFRGTGSEFMFTWSTRF